MKQPKLKRTETVQKCPECRKRTKCYRYLWTSKPFWDNGLKANVNREAYICVCQACGEQWWEHETRPALAPTGKPL